ncbi:MAG: ATP-binding cassette domain-containing protein [Myxococcales bacterium]|nr:ATP-binding cassette domain-containing protein [Polyangiaceae bacterium]MDW8251566.1 ATP-binding cassette domain-containing protein [Myxococcales bacterium]
MALTLAAQLYEVSVVSGQGVGILDDVSIPVLPGEALAVCGPTGSGKSTVLRLLAGLLLPTRGVVRVKGIDLASLDYPGMRALRMKVGLAFDGGGFWSTRSVFENIALPLLYHQAKRPDLEIRVRELADELDLLDLLELPGQAVSGMARKRVILARSLVLDPELLLVDEPQHGLLPREARRLSDAIERRRKGRGMTVVYADHDGKLAPFLCERRIFLENGRIVDRLSRLLSRHDREEFDRGMPPDSLVGDAPESAT